MNKRVLMVAFHYPPCHGSSGLLRTLAFTRYLPEFGWDPGLLTVTPGAYEDTSQSLLPAIPQDMPIARAFTLDTARHLSIGGRYAMAMAIPDRWMSWKYSAGRSARKLIKQFKPDVIWSTYPIATAHQVAAAIHRRHGLPWVADMRDPMVEFDKFTGITFPEETRIRHARLEIEKEVVFRADGIVFCTHGAKSICKERYSDSPAANYVVIPNGFDEASFSAAEASGVIESVRGFKLLHSGTVYPGSDRGPEALFQALKNLHSRNALPAGFNVVLRAVGHEAHVTEQIEQFGLRDVVQLAPSVSYEMALREMLGSSALLLLQGPSSNPAIPAKLYEYFRAGKPILALVHPEGDTAKLLNSLSAGLVTPIDDPEQIASSLLRLFKGVAAGETFNIAADKRSQFSRRNQTADLARFLASVSE